VRLQFAITISIAEPILIPKHKYLSLDAIRGVAAIFVFTRHADGLFWGISFPHSYLAVDLFFVMSGFVIAVAYDSALASRQLSAVNFLKIRAIRLYPLYFLALMSSILLIAHHAEHIAGIYHWSSLLIEIFLGIFMIPTIAPGDVLFPLNGPSWSIFFELIANGIYGKSCCYLTNKMLYYSMGASAAFLMFFVRQNHNMDIGWNWGSVLGGFPRVIYSFAAGLVIYRIRKILRFRSISNNYATLLVLSVTALILGFPVTQYSELFDLIAVLAFFPTLVLFSTYVEPTSKFKLENICALLGLTSYAIYILQAPFIGAYTGLFSKHVHHTFMSNGIIAVLILFVLSLLLDLYYDQPARRWLRHRFSDAKK
jgi:peptidoglycan/LPS O-acetylase OafA/YrhL